MKRVWTILLLLMPLAAARGQCADSTSQGRDFWFHTPLQLTKSLGPCRVIAVSDTEAVVDIYRFPSFNQQALQASDTVSPDSAKVVLTYDYWPGPYHVVASAPVSLYVTYSAQYFTSVTNAVAPLFPSSAAGTHYVVQDYAGNYQFECHNLTGFVAMHDSTLLNFTLPCGADNMPGGYGTHYHYAPNVPYNYYLRVGGTHELNAVSNCHLSGMEVVSDGHAFYMVQGYQNMSTSAAYSTALHMYEPVLPVQYWGTDFAIVTPIMEQQYMNPGSVLARATALYDSTVLWLDGQVAGTLDARQTAELALSPDSAYRLRASGPVEVYLYLVDGGFSSIVRDPEQLLVPDVKQGLESHTFYVHTAPYVASKQLQVVTQTDATSGITLDGTPIGSHFQPIDSSFSYCRIDIDSGLHRLACTQGQFLAHVVGHASTDTAGIGFIHRSDKGFAYLTGMRFKPWSVLNYIGSAASQPDGSVRICLDDTAHFRIRTAAEDTTVQWFVDGVPQSGQQALTFSHLFATQGQHEVSAIVGSRDCDTLRCKVLIGATYSDTLVVNICNEEGYTWHDSTYTATGEYQWGPGLIDGCDSIETLQLTLNTDMSIETLDTFCPNQAYLWRNRPLTAAGLYTDTIRVPGGCDTVLLLQLAVLPQPLAVVAVDTSCTRYHLAATGDSAHYRWSALPPDVALNGHENDSEIDVSPSQTTLYTLSADYDATFGCPVSTSITLAPLAELHAQLAVSPQVLSFDQPTLTALDLTANGAQRWWYVDSAYAGNRSTLTYSPNLWADSVVLMLVVANGECSDTARAVVPIRRSTLWAPNVFTPGEDINNRFRPVGEGIAEGELYIYRRNGMLVAHLPDYRTGWDGTKRGHRCAEETYVWVLLYRTTDNRDLRKAVGTVTLIY